MSRLLSRLPRVRLGRGAIVLTAGVVIAAVVAPFALGANGAIDPYRRCLCEALLRGASDIVDSFSLAGLSHWSV